MELPDLNQQPESVPAWVKVRNLWVKNEKYLAAEFFLAGFLFDIITLKRIDEWLTIIQQGIFLLAAVFLLILKTKNWSPPEKWPGFLHKGWGYRVEAMHFLFGSLLSAFTVFYFKSSSLVVSFGFLAVLCALLVANELKRFQGLELPFKWALLTLCLVSYLSYLAPIVLGFIGVTTFLVSVVLTSLVLWLVYRHLAKGNQSGNLNLKKLLLYPAVGVMVFFIVAYMMQWVPPVPLSLKFVGIYHQVQRTEDGHYELHHQKPWWNFWHNGDQDFKSLSGDKIYCYFRLFSPGGFKDEIRLHWLLKDPKRGWTTQDKIPLKVTGGRAEGFRGFGAKSNYSAGKWRVQVETTEGREIGRIYFNVSEAKNPFDRQFMIDRQ
ncbi:MAG: DUF2914 domain-containing protein [Bdellovibrionaceae bacterium]|nr:DUF2914 domain-containing protein [Bdellovibrionales bacterium]MCB9084992.1 DUF2914 domain-containing protein [Pseudobdellovibrionaceae bacterium]